MIIKTCEINGDNYHDYLGVRVSTIWTRDNENRDGQVTGLAWTKWAVNLRDH